MRLGHAQILSDCYHDAGHLYDLRWNFLNGGYVKLPGLFRTETLAEIRHEVATLMPFVKTRNFTMPDLRTPRKMSVVGGRSIQTGSASLTKLYHNKEVLKLIEEVIWQPAYACENPTEFMVMNVLERDGDTHGWHLDDPSIALVVVLEAPAPCAGGALEYVSHKPLWDQRRELAELGLSAFLSLSRDRHVLMDVHHAPGDAYILRADSCLHRVVPLTGPGKRVAINCAYELVPRRYEPTYGDSAAALYDA